MDKKWYQSRAVWGGIVASAAGIAAAFGHEIAPEHQEALVQAMVGIAGSVGGLLAIYGRIKADRPIK